jgi:hypothetical protein
MKAPTAGTSVRRICWIRDEARRSLAQLIPCCVLPYVDRRCYTEHSSREVSTTTHDVFDDARRRCELAP